MSERAGETHEGPLRRVWGTLGLAARLTWSNRRRLLAISLAVVAPVVALVTVLDLVAWRELDVTAPGVELRELGDSVRAVDATRMTAITVLQYALGALSYALISLLALGRLSARAALGGQGRAPLGPAAMALVLGLVIVAGVRVMMSLSGAAALSALAADSATAYIVVLNLVHGLGKVLTAPVLAALIALLVAAERGAARGS